MEKMTLNTIQIIVTGLGYVGLPLAMKFSEKYNVIGYDIDSRRIVELQNGIDKTGSFSKEDFLRKDKLSFQKVIDSESINKAGRTVYIVTVPTPVDKYRKPDLSSLLSASETIGKTLKRGDIVVYESTVYPGCTEEECVPVLENISGLIFNTDFFCGYSPERINPGDKIHTLDTVVKITSGSTPEIADFIAQLYYSVIAAGIYPAPSIRIAEAAKLIENCQRDVNISFMNELALIFDRLDLDTNEVLKAASTKWNFLPFKPGLVGGHCISVDPHYMIHKAESVGYSPALIGAGREINDSMGAFVASKSVKLLIRKGISVRGANALILGLTFKENCPDIRNTKVIDVYRELTEYGINVQVADSWANPEEVADQLGLRLTESFDLNLFDLIILAVPHRNYESLYKEFNATDQRVVFDLKSFWPKELTDASL